MVVRKLIGNKHPTQQIAKDIHNIQRAPMIIKSDQLLLPPPNKRITTARPNLRQSNVIYHQIDHETPSGTNTTLQLVYVVEHDPTNNEPYPQAMVTI